MFPHVEKVKHILVVFNSKTEEMSEEPFNRHVTERNMSAKEQTAKQALVSLFANLDVCVSSIRRLEWSSVLSERVKDTHCGIELLFLYTGKGQI